MSHVEDASSSLLKKLECLSCDLTGDSAPWPTKAWSKQPAQPVHILTRPPHGNKFAIYPMNAFTGNKIAAVRLLRALGLPVRRVLVGVEQSAPATLRITTKLDRELFALTTRLRALISIVSVALPC